MNNLLDEIIEYLDGATRYERYISANCPFHDDTRPSFFVYEDNYKCLSCGAFGRTEHLLERLGKANFVHTPTPRTYFRNPWTRWLKKNTLSEIIKSASRNAPSVYMRKRGISDKIQVELKIGIRENWITFPIVNKSNNIIGAVARAGQGNQSTAKYVTPAGQSPDLLYIPSWKRLEASRTIFLVFGIIDALSLYLLGLPAFSTTSGKRLNPRALDQFRKYIYILPDHREEKEADKLASQLGWRGKAIVIPYPDDCKDINDLLVKDRAFLLSIFGAQNNDDNLDGRIRNRGGSDIAKSSQLEPSKT